MVGVDPDELTLSSNSMTMPSIVTLTFSPCIDKSATVPDLVPEKKLRCSAPKLEPGGGGINVARALKRLGTDATAVYPSGGYSGKFLDHLMRNEGVDSVIIETVNETRENIIIVDESTNNQYRFGMPANALNENEWMKCLEAVDALTGIQFLVVSGSLPPGVPLSIFSELSSIAKNKSAKLIVDTSGDALKETVKQKVFLLKPNLGELAALAGKDKIDSASIKETAHAVIRQYGCEVIVVSMGPDGAMLITGNDFFTAKAPHVLRKSTVGAGDSMVAGIVYSLAGGNDLHHALRYGVACGTAATMNAGTELCHKEDADRLLAEISN